MKKMKQDLEKSKKNKDLVDQKVPTLELQLSELHQIVNKYSKEAEKDAKKRENLIRDRDTLYSQFGKYKAVFDALQIDDPEKFKLDFEHLK